MSHINVTCRQNKQLGMLLISWHLLHGNWDKGNSLTGFVQGFDKTTL